MDMRIRRAVPRDAEAPTQLMHAAAAYRGAYATILDGYAIDAAQVERDHMHLAERGTHRPGFYSLRPDASGAELDLMFVADAAQGQGAGAALFAHMRGVASGLGCAGVTIVSHPPAKAFYRRMGALRVGMRPPSLRAPWARPILHLPLDLKLPVDEA